MLGTKPVIIGGTTGLFGLLAGFITTWYACSGPLMQSLLMALGVCFWSDTVLGITCAVCLRREKLQSAKLRRVPLKMIQYSGLIVLCYLLDSIYGQVGGHPAHLYLIEIGAVFSIVFHEFTSVLEHLKEMESVTGFHIPDFVGRKVRALQEIIPGAREMSEESAGTPAEEKM